jgi:hypothetical protein
MNQTAAGKTIAATGLSLGRRSSFESRESTPTRGSMNAQTTWFARNQMDRRPGSGRDTHDTLRRAQDGWAELPRLNAEQRTMQTHGSRTDV